MARSVRLSVPWRSCLGYRHAGCLQLSHHRPPEMRGLPIGRDFFWIELLSAGSIIIVSPPLPGAIPNCLRLTCLGHIAFRVRGYRSVSGGTAVAYVYMHLRFCTRRYIFSPWALWRHAATVAATPLQRRQRVNAPAAW